MTSRATIIPAIAPARNPEFPPELDELPLPLECLPGLFLRLRDGGGAVNGGGGGAGPVLQELPSVLLNITLVQDAAIQNIRELRHKQYLLKTIYFL